MNAVRFGFILHQDPVAAYPQNYEFLKVVRRALNFGEPRGNSILLRPLDTL